jgi:hypothetical protein
VAQAQVAAQARHGGADEPRLGRGMQSHGERFGLARRPSVHEDHERRAVGGRVGSDRIHHPRPTSRSAQLPRRLGLDEETMIARIARGRQASRARFQARRLPSKYA